MPLGFMGNSDLSPYTLGALATPLISFPWKVLKNSKFSSREIKSIWRILARSWGILAHCWGFLAYCWGLRIFSPLLRKFNTLLMKLNLYQYEGTLVILWSNNGSYSIPVSYLSIHYEDNVATFSVNAKYKYITSPTLMFFKRGAFLKYSLMN